jgi:mannose-6-phosphate isomerase
MEPLYPFLFELDDMTQSYLWGGEKLLTFGKPGAANQPLAEIWEVSDRAEDDRVSVIANGPLAGKTLRWIMKNHQQDLLGRAQPVNGKFPILVKFLDAKQQLSLQVHPPISVAGQLDGEPKTECWLVLDGTDSSATITVGLQQASDKTAFKTALTNGSLTSLIQTVPVKAGDCMFLPSGRLHAIGAGCLILEVQENSNTTFRAFDWNRIDPKTNKVRELHVEQALASIDFADVQPKLQQSIPIMETFGETLVTCPQFVLERWQVTNSNEHRPTDSFEVITCLTGNLKLISDDSELKLSPLTTSLIPASVTSYKISGTGSYSRVFVPSAL